MVSFITTVTTEVAAQQDRQEARVGGRGSRLELGARHLLP